MESSRGLLESFGPLCSQLISNKEVALGKTIVITVSDFFACTFNCLYKSVIVTRKHWIITSRARQGLRHGAKVNSILLPG